MPIINYSGNLQPAIWLSFQAFSSSGAHASANTSFLYQIENECCTEFTITATTPSSSYIISRNATPSKSLFDSSLNTYLSNPVSSTVLENILQAHTAGNLKLTVSLKIWYHRFFMEVINYCTRDSADTFNLANPENAAIVEDSFSYVRSGSQGIINHKKVVKDLSNIPAMLSGYDIIPGANPSDPPKVKLYIYLKIREDLPDAARTEASQVFIAADYTKIAMYGRNNRTNHWFGDEHSFSRASPDPAAPAPTGIERSLKTWEKNVINYMWNYTNLTRGENIRKVIIQAGVAEIAKSQLEVIQTIRNSIDARMITANHWGDLREDWVTEQYQRKLSDLFGGLHQSKWYASPVSFIRDLSNAHLSNDMDLQSAFILQWGTGHCGEHSTVSYTIIRSLMQLGHSAKFENVIYSGNANIDHAFVVGGIRVSNIIHTSYQKSFSPGNIGEQVDVWDLRATLTANPGKTGFVLDPYLAPSRQAQTASDLLTALNASRRGQKKTDFLWWGGQFPELPAPSEETRPSVKNV
ncbi:MAG TPA: hypothetical protein VHO70_00395 [Chitinispirillaceae bacterium]|nr:hypothetical protein [Chitinispirillaceae bacterium]